MTIINYYNVRQILRTYLRQLGERSRVSREKVDKKFVQQDALTISSENKKGI